MFLGHTWDDNTNLLQTIKSTIKLPIFDEITSAIDANVGETVLLPCTVRNLGDKVVCINFVILQYNTLSICNIRVRLLITANLYYNLFDYLWTFKPSLLKLVIFSTCNY